MNKVQKQPIAFAFQQCQYWEIIQWVNVHLFLAMKWECKATFSSRALWCSKRLLSAFNTSTSLDTPDGDEACRLTTVIRSDRSWRATRHSRCSSSNYNDSHVFQCSAQKSSTLWLYRILNNNQLQETTEMHRLTYSGIIALSLQFSNFFFFFLHMLSDLCQLLCQCCKVLQDTSHTYTHIRFCLTGPKLLQKCLLPGLKKST